MIEKKNLGPPMFPKPSAKGLQSDARSFLTERKKCCAKGQGTLSVSGKINQTEKHS